MKLRQEAITLPSFLQRLVEERARRFINAGNAYSVDFSKPIGEPALIAPNSVSWRVFKNPLALFIGGIAAVILELAEPRVRTGVWSHTDFRHNPLRRIQRTGFAAMVTVYGPRSQAETMICKVSRMHAGISGVIPGGAKYRADDPDLLTWVYATAGFGIVEAYNAYVGCLEQEDRDRFYAEGEDAARLYGAVNVPRSQMEMSALLNSMEDRLEPSPIVPEFLAIVKNIPVLPPTLGPIQGLLVRAAVELLPSSVRCRLMLEGEWHLNAWQRHLINKLARGCDRLLLVSAPAVQACRRMGLPDDYLYGSLNQGA